MFNEKHIHLVGSWYNILIVTNLVGLGRLLWYFVNEVNVMIFVLLLKCMFICQPAGMRLGTPVFQNWLSIIMYVCMYAPDAPHLNGIGFKDDWSLNQWLLFDFD